MTKRDFHVIKREGAFYVLDNEDREISGPWWFRAVAQAHADDLNRVDGEQGDKRG